MRNYYIDGLAASRAGKNSFDGYKELYGTTPVGGSPEWIQWFDGHNAGEKEKAAAKHVAYKVDEFIAKVTALCAEYDAQLSFGCGCCDAGCTIKDHSFSFSVPA